MKIFGNNVNLTKVGPGTVLLLQYWPHFNCHIFRKGCIYVDVQECSTGEQEGTEWVNLGEMIMVYI